MDTFIGLEKTAASSFEKTPKQDNGVCRLSEIHKLEHSRLGSVNKVTFSHAQHSNDSDEACYREYVDCLCRYRHPNVVSVFGIHVHPTGCCVYAEYPDRADILTYMKKREVTWELVLDVTHDVLKGLLFLEKLRKENPRIDIYIQPYNVWMFSPGNAKIAFCAFPWNPSREDGTCGEEVYHRKKSNSVKSFGSTLETLIQYAKESSTSMRCPPILTHLVEVCKHSNPEIIPTFEGLLDLFRYRHPLTCYTAWDISIHNSGIYHTEQWIIHKRHVFKRKRFYQCTNNVENINCDISYIIDGNVNLSKMSFDLESEIYDNENSNSCPRLALEDEGNPEDGESLVGSDETHSDLCRRSSSGDFGIRRSSYEETGVDVSALREACLSDSWEDMTSCNGEDTNGSESFLWDEMLPDIDSRTSSCEEGEINDISDSSECCENDTISGGSCDNYGDNSDYLDTDQFVSIDGFVPGGFPSHDHQECSEKMTGNHGQTGVDSISRCENIRDCPGWECGMRACLSTSLDGGLGLSTTTGDATFEDGNFLGRCQGNALLGDMAFMCYRGGARVPSPSRICGEEKRKDEITLGDNYVIVGRCAELSPLDFWRDYRLDILLLLRDIDNKQSDLPRTSSLKDYRSCLIRCLTKIDRRDFKQNKTVTILEDPNSRSFPVSPEVRINSVSLRPWLKDWKPFDMSLPENGFAWKPVPVYEKVLTEPLEKVPWYGDWEPFDMTIEGEVAWEALPDDVIKEDQPTEQQLSVIHSREIRKHFHDDRAMSIRRYNLASYFKEKYHLSWEIVNPYLDFITRLDENEKELQCLAEDDFCFIIR